jgi:DNA-binding NarL/FixJ family response regulator
MRILIMDDEPLIRECYRSLFQTKDDFLHEECNGADGLITLGQFDFDLVVSDICMPILDGVGFLKVARLRFPLLPIVMVSGGSQYSLEEILKFGASGFLDKMDLDAGKIKELAERWLRSRKLPYVTGT